MTLADGSKLVKNIYKNGISTYREDNGEFEVMHLAKALYAFSGGIATAQDLVDFATAYNSGASLIEYMDDEGKFVLLDNIDMSTVTSWTPIGNAKMVSYAPADGPAFTGHFDGRGYSILNFKMKPTMSTAVEGRTYGLFGFVQNATIENLTMGAPTGDSSELVFSTNGTTDVAVLAGVSRNSTLKNCTNYIPMTVNGNTTDNKRTTMAGFSGYVISLAGEKTVLDSLTNYGAIVANPGSNTKNNAASVHAAGIAGLAHTNINAQGNIISHCKNYGNMTAAVARCAGILAAAQLRTTISDCQNFGNQTNSSTIARAAQISCVISDYCKALNCENYGDITLTKGTSAHVGGLLCLVSQGSAANVPTVEVIGGGNYGKVLSDGTQYRGLLIANMNTFAKVDGLVAGGSIGTYNNGAPVMVSLTADNYMSYIGTYSAANASKITNIIFNGNSAKGIRTADELMDFASLVNAGGNYSKYQQNGVVVLLNDIDMSGKTWTPIGNANLSAGNTTGTISGKAFTGKFNGGGFAIKNLKMNSNSSTAGANYGFFGVLADGAVVENLVFDASSSLNVTATASVASGVVAGYAQGATIRNVKNYAPMTFNGKAGEVFMSMAMIGQLKGDANGATVENCHNYAKIVANNSDNGQSGASCYHVGGIVGFSAGASGKVNTVTNCTNYGDMISQTARTSGIVAACSAYTTLSDCANYGKQTNSFYVSGGGRLGNITCVTQTSTLTNCVNYADLISTTSARCGGIVSLSNDCSFKSCANYGRVLTDDSNRGLLWAYNNKEAKWTNCIAGGLVGKDNGGEPYYDIYWMADTLKYYGIQGTTQSVLTNSVIRMDKLSPDDEEEKADVNIFFIGNSFTQDAVTHLPGLLLAAGIKNVKMTHMYYGGCLMSIYNSEWSTKKNFVRFECKPGGRTWVPSTGYTLEDVANSREWDVVTIQEHTGNSAAWTWNATAKANVSGVISKIRASQSKNPKIYYVMSQAYHDMNKAETKPTWSQEEMYNTIVAFAKGVKNECDIDGLVATGTMLQNLRTSSYNTSLGLSRDGYHMDYGLARYGAACAMFETILSPMYQLKLDNNSYRYGAKGTGHTPVTDASAAVALKAARAAIQRPFQITNLAAEPLGIANASDMYSFLSAVSKGESIVKWTDGNGEVKLLNNINLSSITNAQWQALADSAKVSNSTTASSHTGKAFSGVFNGNKKTISNFNPTVTLAAGSTFGLFSILDGAQVKDLTLEGTMQISAKGQSDAGMLVGTAVNSTFSNVTVKGNINSAGTTVSDKRFNVGGVCGYAFGNGQKTTFDKCISYVAAKIDGGSNVANGFTGAIYGGIVGVATASSTANSAVSLELCTNHGNMDVKVGRCSGIAATCNENTTLYGCVNNGNQTNAIANGRLGNIACYISDGCALINCVNNGDIIASSSAYSGTIAGMVALAAVSSDAYIQGGGNYGLVKAQSVNGNFKALLVANFGGASISDVVASGRMHFAGSEVTINASNYLDYICGNYDSSKMTNIRYEAPAN
ncbi:MAG: DUF4886 domain-containing protein [Bacteroidales bacterium]|nr:DUF4886 domain-containing protein [Bacteroidales bacterium]